MRLSKRQNPIPMWSMLKFKVDCLVWISTLLRQHQRYCRRKNDEVKIVAILGLYAGEFDSYNIELSQYRTQ